MDEFGLIAKYFKPLAKDFSGSLNLSDDAAILSVPSEKELVVTTDAISAGVHFIGDEDPALIAKKALRVNLSDLAAMGATPLCYFLALMLPKDLSEDWIARFAEGLSEDQKLFGISLGGGDTTATLGPLSLAATALGTVPIGKALKRNGAKAGDKIYVSGTLGDAALGLTSSDAFLKRRYQLPEPRLALGQKLIGVANSCMDISDGLLQDLGHICRESNVGAIIHRDKIPLSKEARALIEKDANLWNAPLSGGDDYELLFTAPQGKIFEGATMVGEIVEGDGIQLLDKKGEALKVDRQGYKHF